MRNLLFSRLLAAGLAVLFFCSDAFAQDKKLELGLIGGPNIAMIHLRPSTESDYTPLHRSVAGLSFQYNLSRIFSIHTDILYEEKGAHIHVVRKTAYDNFDVDYTDRLEYLTVPIMLRAGVGSRVRGFAEAGFYASRVLRTETERVDNIDKSVMVSRFDAPRNVDFGAAAGAGVSVRVAGGLTASFEAREHLGLRDLFRDHEEYKHKNSSLNFLFGLGYRFGKPLPAAPPGRSRFEVGLTGGPNYSRYLIHDIKNGGLMPRKVGGLSAQYNLSRTFSVRAELLYEQKGDSTVYRSDRYQVDQLEYLTVPVLLRAGYGNRVRVFADAGVYAARLLRGTVHEVDGERMSDKDVTYPVDYLTQSDFGAAGGLGAAVSLDQGIVVSVEARHHLGLANLQSGLPYRLEINSSATAILFGVSYRLK